MKLRNKKTGQEGNFIINKDHFECVDLEYVPEYRNLAELNAEWEDVEEPKKYWLISPVDADVEQAEMEGDEVDTFNKQIGNYFSSREEVEKAVEKLMAWKRLKDKGFRFEGIKEDYTRILQSQDPFRTGKRYLQFNKSEDEDWMKENWEDLDLLFGGEDD